MVYPNVAKAGGLQAHEKVRSRIHPFFSQKEGDGFVRKLPNIPMQWTESIKRERHSRIQFTVVGLFS
jgi:hypothetical protein